MANYLATGGCGFIGSHLVESLLNDGHQVRILDNLSTGKRENVPSQCEVIRGDVANSESVRVAMDGVDGCFHLAAIASVQASNEHWVETHQSNLTGTIPILNAARKHRTPVVYASSAAVYGDSADLPLRERSVVQPLTAYGADKRGSEQHARVASLVHGVPTMGLRFFNVFGPRQAPNSPYSGVISIFVDRVLRGEGLTIFGDGEQVRDFIYVSDVVRFLRTAMNKAGRTASVFNVCTGVDISVNQLASSVHTILGVEPNIRHAPSRQGDIRVSVGDPRHAHQILGMRTTVID